MGSSHYFTPSSSFQQPDSLEYSNVKGSPPVRVRKASLDRILSPQSGRKMYTSSPSSSSKSSSNAPVIAVQREKSISPVSSRAGGAVHRLSTSMSNASIHSTQSNYSEDSLMACSSSNDPTTTMKTFNGRLNAPPKRNNVNVNNSDACYSSLPCGHFNWTQVKTSPVLAQCDTPIKE